MAKEVSPCRALESCPTLSGAQTPPEGDVKGDRSQHVSRATCQEADWWCLRRAQQPHRGRSEQPLFIGEGNKEQGKGACWPEASRGGCQVSVSWVVG